MKRFIKIFSFALVLSLFFTNAYSAVVHIYIIIHPQAMLLPLFLAIFV